MTLPWTLLGATTSSAATDRSPAHRDRHAVGNLLAELERAIAADPTRCFGLAGDGTATLRVGDRSYHAGRFEVPTIASLRERTRGQRPAGIRLSILRGSDPLTDIGALQASAPPGTLFQVASQFNCLEAPSAHLVPVQHYPNDPTQGPRASVSAFPGTFLRHYFAPRDGHPAAPASERFVQTDADCVDLLATAIADPQIARVQSGYLTTNRIADIAALADRLAQRFDQIRIGLHDDVEVALGGDWGGPVPRAPDQRVAQALTSTIALGMYSDAEDSRALAAIARQLLRAAYLGTLLGASALGKHTVVLTLIGGGVFGNPHDAIWDAIHWALAEADRTAGSLTDVVVNARTDALADEDLDQVTARGGTVLDFARDEIRIRR
jgi:hypothetical protein